MQKYVIIPESPNETAGKDVQNASGVSQKYSYPFFILFLIADYMILPIFAATNK